MDYVHIEHLILHGKHGVSERERVDGHVFDLSLKLGVDMAEAAHTDRIKDAVDYDPIRKIVEEIVTTHSYHLIERLADVIIARILEDVRILSVQLTIKKTEIWENGVPGITVERTRS